MTYMLGASEDEQQRLYDHLESFGQKRLAARIQTGMHILDVGCGPGAVTALLGGATGPSGSVIGIDMQQAQLDAAAEHAKSHGLDNVTFQVADATALPFADATFDLVYAKFLVMHLPDPIAGLNEMSRVLKPGGTLFLYEVDRGGSFFHPEGTATERAWDLAMETLEAGGSDPEMGRKLFSHLRALGLEGIRAIPELTGACSAQPRLLAASKRQIIGVLASMRDKVLTSDAVSEEELDRLVTEVLAPQDDEFFTTCGISAWGRKPIE